MTYGIDLGRQPGKSVFWKQQLYEGSRAGGKTARIYEEVEALLHEQSWNREEETPAHLQARWLSVRVLQVTGLSDLGPSAAEIRRMGLIKEIASSLRSQFSYSVPGLQFFSAEQYRAILLHQDELEDRRAVEDHLVASLSGSQKDYLR